jgi:chorismate dehydratase
MIRIGEISYLNCTPIFSMLRGRFADPDYRFVRGTPAELNQRLRNGEIDICPSSSIEYARNPASYLILPGVSIASTGAVKSVLLFSPLPLEELDGAEIVLTGESETSVVLLKILLACRYAFTNSFRSASGAEQACIAGSKPLLLIGDRALQAALARHNGYVYDLGELWFEFTGLPFVFALWLVRSTAVEKESAAFRLLAERLVLAKQFARAGFAAIAAVTVRHDWISEEFLLDYWQTISYELNEKHQEGLQLFFRLAVECGILQYAPPLRLFV